MLALPPITELSERIAVALSNGQWTALVGPPGVGTTCIAAMARDRIGSERFLHGGIDCRERISWREQMRAIVQGWAGWNPDLAKILVVDHASDLDPVEVDSMCRTVLTRPGPPVHAMFWVGNIDIRALHACGVPRLHATPRTHFMVPDLAPDDLVQIYREIARAHECDWGEALLHFILDWCGNDLALVGSVTEYFYGNWQSDLQDGAVADCLGRWLAEDRLVEEYRQNLQSLPDPCKTQLRLLGIGGKLPCTRREIDQEVDDHVRLTFFRGVLAGNLLPGYYQFRNLTMRYLWSEIDDFGKPLSPLALLRGSANARVNQLLQDIEWSLRHLLARVLKNLGIDESRERLRKIRIVEKGITSEFTKKMLATAQAQGGSELRESLNKVLIQCRHETEANENLWEKVCHLYRKEFNIPDEQAEPSLSEVPAFLTLSELSNTLLSWKADVFSLQTSHGESLPAPERWREYLARIQRLRNQTAHLRNVGFQDIEDLLANVRAIRTDFRTGMRVLDPVTAQVRGVAQ